MKGMFVYPFFVLKNKFNQENIENIFDFFFKDTEKIQRTLNLDNKNSF